MSRILRTAEKRRTPERYVSIAKRRKINHLRPQQPNITTTNAAQKIRKLEEENVGLKEMARTFQSENESLKVTVATQMQTIEALTKSIDSLEMSNFSNIGLIENLEASLNALKVENNLLRSAARIEGPVEQVNEGGNEEGNEGGNEAGNEELKKELNEELCEVGSFCWEKINEIPQYMARCSILKQKPKESAEFIRYIAENIFEDDITDYVTATAVLLFKKTFFIEQVSFKHEANRVCVKDTKIIKCMEERIKQQFGNETDFPTDVNGFIQKTFSSFKKKVKRNPLLWNEN